MTEVYRSKALRYERTINDMMSRVDQVEQKNKNFIKAISKQRKEEMVTRRLDEL